VNGTIETVAAAIRGGVIRDPTLEALLDRLEALTPSPPVPDEPRVDEAARRVAAGEPPETVVADVLAARRAREEAILAREIIDRARFDLSNAVTARIRADSFIAGPLRDAWHALLDEVRAIAGDLAPLVGKLGDPIAVAGAPPKTRRAYERYAELVERYRALVEIRRALEPAPADKFEYFLDLREAPPLRPGVRSVAPSNTPRRGPEAPAERLVWLATQPDAVMPTKDERSARWRALCEAAASNHAVGPVATIRVP
jgi:hypothetical protein